MLSLADDVAFGYQPQAHGQGWLVMHLGQRSFRLKRMERLEYRSLRRWSEQAPQRMAVIDTRSYWMYEGHCYVDDDGLSRRQVGALLAVRLAS